MTKTKNTKRALLLSLCSMMLCVAMLAGSTFAWFTDSVESVNNQIVAGNLDVDLLAKDGSDYKSVTATTNLFLKDALWEPGHVEVVNLKIANVGKLALTYKLGINKANEIGSVNVYGDPFKLSDYIMFALIDGEKTFAGDDEGRAAAIAAAEANSPAKLSTLLTPNEQDDVLYPAGTEGKDSEKLVTLVVYMPWDTDNHANYRTGEAVPTINLGVKLEATQTPHEKDSFSDKYDEKAKDDILTGTTKWFDEEKYADTENYSIASASDLLAFQQAVKQKDFAGKTVTLTENIDLSAYENWEPIGSEEKPFAGTFDGADKEIRNLKIIGINQITGRDKNGIAGLFGVVNGAEIKNLTVSGNITVTETEAGLLSVGGICGATKGDVTITGCTNNVSVDLTKATGEELSNGGAITIGGILGNAEFGQGSDRTITITNCINNADLKATEDPISFVGGMTATAYLGTYNFEGSVNNGDLAGTIPGGYLDGLVGIN